MTGSGKTGLCLALLEEAAIDGIPALVIDPKGDLANLLLTFPAAACRANSARGSTRTMRGERARAAMPSRPQQAELWTKGLAEWGQDGARITRLRDAADFAIYTPGSQAGMPVSVLHSFAAPPPRVRDDAELLRERVEHDGHQPAGPVGHRSRPDQSRASTS